MFVLNVLFVLISATSTLGAKKIYCDLADVNCTTESAAKVYYYEIAGQKGLWASSDPLKPNLVVGRTSDLSIKTFNGVLTGLLQCDLVYLKMDTEAKTMEYDIVCGRLTEAGEYVVQGHIGDEYVNGKGNCKVNRDQYKLIIKTKYESYFRHGKEYIHITDYKLIFDSECKVSYYCDTKLFNGDKKKADKVLGYMNENWESMEETIGHQMMRTYMSKYIKNINDELKVIPINEFFYYEV